MSEATAIRPAAILLAAGASRRMGQPKQLLPVGQRTLLEHVLSVVDPILAFPPIVVLGAQADRIRQRVRPPRVLWAYNPNWEEGMGSSLRKGIEHLMAHYPRANPVFLLVVDQAGIYEAHLRALLNRFHPRERPLLASAYLETVGTPVLLDRRFLNTLLATEGDKGARWLLRTQTEQLTSIPFPEGAFDLDTPEDYRRFLVLRALNK